MYSIAPEKSTINQIEINGTQFHADKTKVAKHAIHAGRQADRQGG